MLIYKDGIQLEMQGSLLLVTHLNMLPNLVNHKYVKKGVSAEGRLTSFYIKFARKIMVVHNLKLVLNPHM